MDFNTLLVIVVDGGLAVFFLYALNSTRHEPYGSQPHKSTSNDSPKVLNLKKQENEQEPKPIPKPAPNPAPEPEPEKESEKSPERRIMIIDIEGIGPVYSEKLNDFGIKYIDELLDTGATRKGRRELAEETGISSLLIMDWINLADLYRIKNIAGEWSDLLEEADVNTVVELAQRNPENLYATLVEVNESKNLVRRLPNLDQIEDWIKQAKNLPRKVEY